MCQYIKNKPVKRSLNVGFIVKSWDIYTSLSCSWEKGEHWLWSWWISCFIALRKSGGHPIVIYILYIYIYIYIYILFNNFFNSPMLKSKLLENDIYEIYTVTPNLKHMSSLKPYKQLKMWTASLARM